MTVFLFIIVIVGLVTCGQVCQTLFEQRSSRPAPVPGSEAELRELRERVAELTDEVERLSEEQRFMTRLLEAAPPGATRSAARGRQAGSVREPSTGETNDG